MDIIVKNFHFRIKRDAQCVHIYSINDSTLITNQKTYTFIYMYMSSSMAFK